MVVPIEATCLAKPNISICEYTNKIPAFNHIVSERYFALFT